jgi:hypothetical protein
MDAEILNISYASAYVRMAMAAKSGNLLQSTKALLSCAKAIQRFLVINDRIGNFSGNFYGAFVGWKEHQDTLS